MAARKDNRGRNLRTGESQRSDGRYAYKYKDLAGNTQFVYSWKLVQTDRIPKGKRNDISLREKEEEIQRDLNDHIDTVGKKMTLCELYAKQNASRSNVREGTERNRKNLMNILERDELGSRSIDSIKPSDAKAWALRMKEEGYAYQTIHNMKRSLTASFYIAIEDDCVRKNPFTFKLPDVLEDDTIKKEALTDAQVDSLLVFLKSDKVYSRYYDVFIVLLKTGLRISEFCGLTDRDLDFENRFIHVNHQLLHSTKSGYYIGPPKTDSGYRDVPMSHETELALRRVMERREDTRHFTVDGYCDFVFLNSKNRPMLADVYCALFQRILRKYNKTHTEQIEHLTPHILRHTFCSRLAHKGMNPKSLQYIMGHANIAMTLDYYTHTSTEYAQSEMDRLVA